MGESDIKYLLLLQIHIISLTTFSVNHFVVKHFSIVVSTEAFVPLITISRPRLREVVFDAQNWVLVKSSKWP